MSLKWKIFLTILLALVPFPTEMVPTFRLQVIDESQQPVSGVKIEQTWSNYTFSDGFSSADTQDFRTTDKGGFVVFPARRLWASPLSRIVYPPLAALSALFLHGSAGTYVSIRANDEKYYSEKWLYWQEKETLYFREQDPLPTKLVVARNRHE